MPTTDHRTAHRPSGPRVLAAGLLAGALSVAVNLAIRALALALTDPPEMPFPLVLPPVIEFTFLPTLLGTLLFLLLRRVTARPVRWFTVAAVAVVVLSWLGPLALYAAGRIGPGVLLALVVMHVVPGAVLVAVLRRITPYASGSAASQGSGPGHRPSATGAQRVRLPAGVRPGYPGASGGTRAPGAGTG